MTAGRSMILVRKERSQSPLGGEVGIPVIDGAEP